MAGGSPPRGACWGGEGRRDPRACPRSPARGRQPRRRGDGPSLAGRGGQSGAAPAPPRGRSGPELTERGSRDGGQGSGSLEDKTSRFSRSDELLWGRGELPLPLCLPLMNGPGGWIVQSVLYLHQTVKPLPLLIICHNFTEHTLRPKGSPCPAACPFPPLSGRALCGRGARGRGAPAAESSPRPLPGLFPLGCPRSPRPKGPVPPGRGLPRPLSPVPPCRPREPGRVVPTAAGAGRAEGTPENSRLPRQGF